jgi:hypothetical protein
MLTGIHTIASQAAVNYAEIAYRAVLNAAEGYTEANKQCQGANMRGQKGIANFCDVFQHRWRCRSASTLPNF